MDGEVQAVDRFAYVAVDRRAPDAEPGGEVGMGVAVPRASARVEQGAVGQVHRRRMDKRAKLLAGHGGSWP